MFRKERKPAYVKTFVAFLLLPLIVVAAFLFFKPLSSLGQAIYTIYVSNAGGGSVISNPPGISCGAGGTDCSESYPYGRNVRLNPAPVFGYGFTGWCNCPAVSNNDVCIIDVNGNLAVTATFSAFYTISVTNAGGGSVISNPAGISCGAGGTDCSEPYAYGTNVVLT